MAGPKTSEVTEEQRAAERERLQKQAALEEADRALRQLIREAERTLKVGLAVCKKTAKQLTREERLEQKRVQEATDTIEKALLGITSIKHLTTPYSFAQREAERRLEERAAQQKLQWRQRKQAEASRRREESLLRLLGVVNGTEE